MSETGRGMGMKCVGIHRVEAAQKQLMTLPGTGG